MSYYYSIPLVDETELVEARRMLGAGFLRIIGYFQEDGAKSIKLIEQAMAAENAAALVIPAHTLKGESRQFGAKRLSDLSEAIEKAARRCLEQRCAPTEVASEVAMLRACFIETLAHLGIEPPRTATAPTTGYASAATLTLRTATDAGGQRTFGRRPIG